MKTRRKPFVPAALAVGLLLLALLVGLFLSVAAAGSGRVPPMAWTRTLEPAVFRGEQLPEFDGAALGDLFVYAYDGSTWAQIPFQFDEVDADGVYTVENGLLDGNDELVLMAMDLGAQAATWEWIDDTDSRAYVRYELLVTNPLAPAEQGWAYVYRSATLTPALPADYVDWEAATNRLVAGTYVLGFDPASHAGFDAMELNGSGVDALDRSKIRLNVDCYIGPIPFNQTLTEDDLAGTSATPTVDGPVRVGGGGPAGSTWAYYSLNQSRVVYDMATIEPPDPCSSIVVRWIRLSNDWRDPSASGMAPATYYDANTAAGVAIDGVADTVPASPATDWRQVSGEQGTVVQVGHVSLAGGTRSNYYLDNQVPDLDDTGDQRSYGDAGTRVNSPSGQVVIDMQTFVLDPQQSNLGAMYQAYQDQPLECTALAQAPCLGPAQVDFVWAPQPVYAGVSTTFWASVGTGDPPFTYTWAFGDDGSVGAGNPVTHTFALTGTFAVTVTASNACGVAAPAVHQVPVAIDPGSDYQTYLPVVLK